MFFTQEDIQKISKGLAELSIKDTQLPGTEEVLEQDCLAIVQDGKNKKVSVRDFLNNLGVLKKSDFINISALTDNTYNNIDEVVHEVPVNCRKPGLCVTFQDTDYNWKIYQFRGEANQWDVLTFWVDILDYSSYVVNGILPDEEDLTVSGKDEKDNLLLSLKDRKPSEDFVGKGYKILRRNIVKKQVTKTGILINKAATTTGTVGITISGITTMITLTTSDNTVEAVAKTIYDALIDNEKMSGFYITYESNTVFVENKFTLNSSISTVGKTSSGAEIYVNDEDIEVDKNILTQAAINQPNTIYEIRYDFDLYGAEIVIPEDCVLKFEGGSFKNGKIIYNNTYVENIVSSEINCSVSGALSNNILKPEYYGARGAGKKDDTKALQCCIQSNKVVYLEGIYYITNSINIENINNLSIINGTITRPIDTKFTTFLGSNSYRIFFKNIIFEGNGNNRNMTYAESPWKDNVQGCIILAGYCRNIYVDKCVIRNHNYGIYILGTDKNEKSFAGNYDNIAYNGTITNCIFNNCNSAIDTYGKSILIQHNTFLNDTEYCVQIEPNSVTTQDSLIDDPNFYQSAMGVNIDNNTFISCVGACIIHSNATHVKFTNNNITDFDFGIRANKSSILQYIAGNSFSNQRKPEITKDKRPWHYDATILVSRAVVQNNMLFDVYLGIYLSGARVKIANNQINKCYIAAICTTSNPPDSIYENIIKSNTITRFSKNSEAWWACSPIVINKASYTIIEDNFLEFDSTYGIYSIDSNNIVIKNIQSNKEIDVSNIMFSNYYSTDNTTKTEDTHPYCIIL